MKAPLGEDDEEVDAAWRDGEAVEPFTVAPPAPAPAPALLIPAISAAAGGGPGIRRALDVVEERACAREKRRRREAMVATADKEGERNEQKSREERWKKK
jgi:hypothetical protein